MVDLFDSSERHLHLRIREEALVRRELLLEQRLKIDSNQLEEVLGRPDADTWNTELPEGLLVEYEKALGHREAAIEQLLDTPSLAAGGLGPNPHGTFVVALLSSRIREAKSRRKGE